MAAIKLYKQTGEVAGELNLDDTVFGVDYNEALIHQVVVAQMANARQGTKSALTRTEVRGGGIKPWKQKGTGRARQGSTRAPQWIHGGVVFAPKPRDFSKKVNKKAKDIALKSALSEKVATNELLVLETLAIKDAKTKEMVAILKNFRNDNKTLLVISDKDGDIIRATNNIPNVTTICADLINVYDLVANSTVIATKEAILNIEEAYKG